MTLLVEECKFHRYAGLDERNLISMGSSIVDFEVYTLTDPVKDTHPVDAEQLLRDWKFPGLFRENIIRLL